MMMSYPIKSPRKLIEVALPLDAINVAATQEKGNPFLKGHPRNLHQWWARRPMAAARAVIFGQLVNDPSYQQGGGFRYGKHRRMPPRRGNGSSKSSKTPYCGKIPATRTCWSAPAPRFAARG